jgi:hypothetical protein
MTAFEPGRFENPFQSPRTDARAVGVRTGSMRELYNVARYQRAVLLCLLVQILGGVASVLIAPSVTPPIALLLNLGLLLIGLASTVFVFLLATNVYSTAVGVVCGLLALIPCIGLITLLIINSKATNILRQNGIRVGFLGANLAELARDTE